MLHCPVIPSAFAVKFTFSQFLFPWNFVCRPAMEGREDHFQWHRGRDHTARLTPPSYLLLFSFFSMITWGLSFLLSIVTLHHLFSGPNHWTFLKLRWLENSFLLHHWSVPYGIIPIKAQHVLTHFPRYSSCTNLSLILWLSSAVKLLDFPLHFLTFNS